jgi:hypothetical protein
MAAPAVLVVVSVVVPTLCLMPALAAMVPIEEVVEVHVFLSLSRHWDGASSLLH